MIITIKDLENVAQLSALLHDICEKGYYAIYYRNKKVTDPETGSYEMIESVEGNDNHN